MMKSLIRLWSEALDNQKPGSIDLNLDPEGGAAPGLDVLDISTPPAEDQSDDGQGLDIDFGDTPPPETKAPDSNATPELTRIGNLGSTIVGTVAAWVDPDSGFLVKVKNPDMLDEGIDQLLVVIRRFNEGVRRISSQGITKMAPLVKFSRSPLFTTGIRLTALKSSRRGERESSLKQLQLLSPVLTREWEKLIENENLGIRPDNPTILEAPAVPQNVEDNGEQEEAPVPLPVPLAPPAPEGGEAVQALQPPQQTPPTAV